MNQSKKEFPKWVLFCVFSLMSPLILPNPNQLSIKNLTLKTIKNSFSYVKKDFFDYMVDLFNIRVLVETGTYSGETLYNALSSFEQLYSIELSPQLYAQATKKFENNPHVHLYLGDSANVLLSLLPTVQGKILFWLDGHYSGGGTAKGESNTPIIGELKAIKTSGIQDAVILIDDIRIFGCSHEKNIDETLTGYPTIQELFDLIRTINPNYTFFIYGDTALAFLSTEPINVSPVIKACTTSRFFMENPENLELKSAEDNIQQAQGEEREAIYNLYRTIAIHDPYNLGTIYKRWYQLLTRK